MTRRVGGYFVETESSDHGRARARCQWVVTLNGVLLGYFDPYWRAVQYAEQVPGSVIEAARGERAA